MTIYSTTSNAFMSTLQANYDARKYPLCAPHDGRKGRAFRLFEDRFLTAIALWEKGL